MMIMVAGLPGSGKSFFAKRLADRLDAIYISSDQVRDSLNARGKYSPKDKSSVYEKMVSLAKAYLKENNTVVLDATFYQRVIREQFFALAAKSNVPVHLILVTAEEELIRQRMDMPRKDSEADFSIYQKVKAEFEEITESHLLLRSTNENISTMLEQAIRYVGK